MKKLTFLFAVMIASFLVIGNAYSFSLDISEMTSAEISMDNWEVLGDLPAPTIDTNGDGVPDRYYDDDGDGTEDNYGVFELNSIDPNVLGAPLWSQGDDGEYIFGVFYGIDYQTVTYKFTEGTVNLQAVGGFFDLYLVDDPNAFYDSGILGEASYYDSGDGIAHNEYNGITNVAGVTHFLSFELVPGIDPNNDTTVDGNTDTSTAPLSGDSTWYGSVTGGEYDWIFDTDGWTNTYIDDDGNTQTSTADLYGVIDFGPGSGTDWPIESQDPIETYLATPEPTTMLLLGVGLLGLAGMGRRRKNS